jgi:hypothetical protein
MTTSNFEDALSLVQKLSIEDQRALLHTLQKTLASSDDEQWALEGAQLAFMLQHRDVIEAAYDSDDMAALDVIEGSDEYRVLFGDMSWDEAYDRFEETWWIESD